MKPTRTSTNLENTRKFQSNFKMKEWSKETDGIKTLFKLSMAIYDQLPDVLIVWYYKTHIRYYGISL